jgi:hypothetical protein
MAEENETLEGIKISPDAPSFNHLLFGDDSLILLKVSEESTTHLQNILTLYEDCSGQTINADKTSIMFSKNTKWRHKKGMMQRLGLVRESWNERYLGLPVYVGQSRMKTFTYIKDRIWQRIQGGKKKFYPRQEKKF